MRGLTSHSAKAAAPSEEQHKNGFLGDGDGRTERFAGRGVQSVEVGAKLLAALVEVARPMMLKDLAAKSAMASAQAHTYLLGFKRAGLVEQAPATGRYLLGPFALHMGLVRTRSVAPLNVAFTAATDLALQTGFMVLIGVWGSHGPPVLYKQDGRSDLHIALRPCKITGLLDIPLGRVVAARESWGIVEPKLREELAAGQLPPGVPNQDDCQGLIVEVRVDSYSAMSEAVPGVHSVAAPVFDLSNRIQFVITIIARSKAPDIVTGSAEIARLLAFTQGLSHQLGYTPEQASCHRAPERAHSF